MHRTRLRLIIGLLTKFVFPNRWKLLVFFIIVSIFMVRYEDRILEAKQKQAYTVVHQYRYGKPYIYFIVQHDKPPKFFYTSVIKNTVIAYAATLLIFLTLLLLGRIFLRQPLKQRGLALLLLLSLMVIPYATVYVYGGSLLIHFVNGRNYLRANILLMLGISPNSTSADDLDFPLKEAAYNKDEKMTYWLLTRGADVNKANSLGETALHIAVRENALNIAKILIAKGANVNAQDTRGNSPLFFVGREQLATLLLEHKADVKLRNKKQQSPLFVVNDEVVKELFIKAGMDVSLVDEAGDNALFYVRAASEVVVLAKAGIKMSIRNKKGQTALHQLVAIDKATSLPWAAPVIEAIVKQGGQVDIADNLGMSPLHYAIQNCSLRAKTHESIDVVRELYKGSEEVKTHRKTNKLVGKLAEVVDADKDGCWKEISHRPVTQGSEQKPKTAQ